MTALKISRPSLVLCTGLIYPQRTCCVGLTCQPVLYTTAVTGSGFQGDNYLFKSQLCQVLGFKEAAICLISFICIFLGLGDLFFFLSFLSSYLVFCVCGKLPTPLEKYLCTDHCQTEVHTSSHLWAILLCQEEQILLFSTTEVWYQNA